MGGFLISIKIILDIRYMVMYTVNMIRHYPYQVTYRKRHPNPSPWINKGNPYCDTVTSSMEFMTKDKADTFIARKKSSGTGAYLKLREGDFTIEEYGI